MSKPVEVHSSPAVEVYSIGYERRTVEELTLALKENRIELLIDVRALPVSRRKGFSKNAFSAALRLAGIDYLHLKEAGNPFRSSEAPREQVLADYASHLEQHPEVIEALEAAVRGRRAALMCLERDVRECHRGVLLEKLLERVPALSGHPL